MIIDFDKMDDTVLEHFNGGEGRYIAKMFVDENGKIMRGKLEPGSSIGLHTHKGSYEVIYILKGFGKVLYEGGELEVAEGSCHYCPPEHTHSLINDGTEDLIFFAIVPLK